jgi:uncharacterized protein YggU (UPF0235/DUF167 family)
VIDKGHKIRKKILRIRNIKYEYISQLIGE